MRLLTPPPPPPPLFFFGKKSEGDKTRSCAFSKEKENAAFGVGSSIYIYIQIACQQVSAVHKRSAHWISDDQLQLFLAPPENATELILYPSDFALVPPDGLLAAVVRRTISDLLVENLWISYRGWQSTLLPLPRLYIKAAFIIRGGCRVIQPGNLDADGADEGELEGLEITISAAFRLVSSFPLEFDNQPAMLDMNWVSNETFIEYGQDGTPVSGYSRNLFKFGLLKQGSTYFDVATSLVVTHNGLVDCVDADGGTIHCVSLLLGVSPGPPPPPPASPPPPPPPSPPPPSIPGWKKEKPWSPSRCENFVALNIGT